MLYGISRVILVHIEVFSLKKLQPHICCMPVFTDRQVLHLISYMGSMSTKTKHVPLHALELRTRRTAGGMVDDPSVSAS